MSPPRLKPFGVQNGRNVELQKPVLKQARKISVCNYLLPMSLVPCTWGMHLIKPSWMVLSVMRGCQVKIRSGSPVLITLVLLHRLWWSANWMQKRFHVTIWVENPFLKKYGNGRKNLALRSLVRFGALAPRLIGPVNTSRWIQKCPRQLSKFLSPSMNKV